MITLVPLSAASWCFKGAIIKGIRQNLVDGAPSQRVATRLACSSRPEAPLLIGEFEKLRRSVAAREHHVPYSPDNSKPFRVLDQSFFTGHSVHVVQVSHRSHAGIPALLDFSFQSSLHVLAQVINVFLSHSEFDIHEDYVVVLAGVALGRRHDPDTVLLDRPND